jgi:guanylate kinase
MKPTIFVLTGPSGAGKTTIENFLTEQCNFKRIPIVTTREKRPDDWYKFIDITDWEAEQETNIYHITSDSDRGIKYYGYKAPIGQFNIVSFIDIQNAIDFEKAIDKDKYNVIQIGITLSDEELSEIYRARGFTDKEIAIRKEAYKVPKDIPVYHRDEVIEVILKKKQTLDRE